MIHVAFRMLIGDRAKFIGILVGITFASLLITQQAAIFNGLMARTYGLLTDTGEPDIWVMNTRVNHVDDIKPLRQRELYQVRGTEGVAWAVPMVRSLLQARLPDGTQQAVWVIGLDEATLIGGPPNIISGQLSDLKGHDGIILDVTEAKDKLVRVDPKTGKVIPFGVGDVLEIEGRRVRIVGLAENTPTFQSQPVIYMAQSKALEMISDPHKPYAYILAGLKPGYTAKEVTDRISEKPDLLALTQQEFMDKTYDYFFDHTGIPVNFGIAVALGFVVGMVIAGQTFFNFTLGNLRHFGMLKAMGASNRLILKVIIVQALFVGAIGYGFGIGLAALFGIVIKNTELSFLMPFSLLLFTGFAVLLICLGSALLSITKVLRLEPAIVFRS